MKTTKVLFVIIALISVVIFSSCESRSGKRVREIKKVEKVSAQKADTFIFSPDHLGVTKLIKKFTPYPNYDGGTGMEISFSIGVQYKEKIHEIEYTEREFFDHNLSRAEAEQGQRIATVAWAHDLLEIIPKKNVNIVVVSGEIVKISTSPTFGNNGNFTPSQVVWEKK